MNHVQTFTELAKRTLHPKHICELVAKSSFEEKVSFHKVHERLLAQDISETLKSKMDEWYPFVKVGGKWRFSCARMYMYLFYSRHALLKTNNELMYSVHDAVVNMCNYHDDLKRLNERLTPSQWQNLDEYNKLTSKIYEDAMMVQTSIFETIDRQVERGVG